MPCNRDFILNNLQRAQTNHQALVDCIREGAITFEELKETGVFRRENQDAVLQLLEPFLQEEKDWEAVQASSNVEEIRGFIQKYQEGQNVETAWDRLDNLAWQEAVQTNSIPALRAYMNEFQDRGKFLMEAEEAIDQIRQRNEKEKKVFLQSLAEGKDITSRTLEEYLNNGVITEDDLFENEIIDPWHLDKFLNPPDLSSLDEEWSEPKMENEATDIYFLGIPSSGKTCLLAGLIYHGHRSGKLEFGVENLTGVKYGHGLVKVIENEYVPDRTRKDLVNFIDVNVYRKNRVHPLNIIEMSGEIFVNTYKGNEDGLTKYGFLKNKNRKVLCLIVDYKKDSNKDKETNIHGGDQALQLSTVMKLLERDQDLMKTVDGIYIILTKSDLLPNGQLDYPGADEFLRKEYASLRNYISRLEKKYKIAASILTFSLGKFMLGKTFIYDDTTSRIIFDEITQNTYHRKA